MYALRNLGGGAWFSGAPYAARLPKSHTHVVSLYSGEAAECILGCNSTYNHGMCEKYII